MRIVLWVYMSDKELLTYLVTVYIIMHELTHL